MKTQENFQLPASNRNPKIAIVCDWLTNMGGAEDVVRMLHLAFPNAPIYTSVFDPIACPYFKNLDVRTTYLQKLPPKIRTRHQLFPTLRANAFRKLDLSEYDVVISAASAEAKAVRVRKDAVHICYCHTPTRYYWSHYHEYIAEPGFGPLNPMMRVALPALVHFMRRADFKAAQNVDYFIANSSAVAERIKKYYRRNVTVIHPAVNIHRFKRLHIDSERSGYIVVGRQVAYKRMDLAVEACNKLGLSLTLYGNGPMNKKLKAQAGPTIKFVIGASDVEVDGGLVGSKAFLHPQDEDFGITQVQAMAAGTPVIAYAKGGALDVVKDGQNGLFFKEQTAEALAKAIKRFETMQFNHKEIQKYAGQFSEERFIKELRDFVTRVSTSNDIL